MYQNIIYFCKTIFGALIGGNVLTSYGINKACREKADVCYEFLPSSSPAIKWVSRWGLEVITVDHFRPSVVSGRELRETIQRCLSELPNVTHRGSSWSKKPASGSLRPFGTLPVDPLLWEVIAMLPANSAYPELASRQDSDRGEVWRSCWCGCWFVFLWKIKCHIKNKQNKTKKSLAIGS